MPARPVPTDKSLLNLTRALVRIPSRAAVDDYRPMLAAIGQWLHARNIASEQLLSGASPVGMWGMLRGKGPGPTYVLNATVDTAGFGDVSRWTYGPASAAVSGGWLYGRGSADSKAGIAVFCHVVEALQKERNTWRGRLVFLFDAEEHSGSFAGVRRFIAEQRHPNRIDGVMIGYPGHDAIVTGCRGFFRATIRMFGLAGHSGSSRSRGINAVTRAAGLVADLNRLDLPSAGHGKFPLPPQLTVTGIRGGGDYSAIPDECHVDVDIRLTPGFDEAKALRTLTRALRAADKLAHPMPPSELFPHAGWPAYQLPKQSKLYRAIRDASASRLGLELPARVAGPSSVGNYLATLGIEATSGFGVRYRGMHGHDECIELATLEPTFDVYLGATRLLLT